MIVGIGIDVVNVDEFARLSQLNGEAFISHTFTENEIREAESASSKTYRLATRFAVKEATFKAIAHHTKGKSFDFRIVETLSEPDGCPAIHPDATLQQLLDEVSIGSLHVSISDECGLAIAIVVAESNY